MKITLHDYATDPSLPQKDGVNLAHENIASVLRNSQEAGFEVCFHDFNRLLAEDRYAREVLGGADCVVSNVGPHAHYYFYLREKLGLDFRILRDVRTAIWSSYLLQEHLCQPWLRKGDVLMVASNYTRGVYEKIFPHLSSQKVIRCYPLTVSFPELAPRRQRTGGTFTLGYVGRLSEDKNFPEVVELLIALNRRRPGQYRLLACGQIHSPACDPVRIRRHIRAALGDSDCFEYLPARPHCDVWELYQRFDAMVFPSTSNLETLGRVLVEASHAGVPVICGEHAAAPELVPAASLCKVAYRRQQTFMTHFDHSLGEVDVEEMARSVMSHQLRAASCHLEYASHPEKLLALLADVSRHGTVGEEKLALTQAQRDFIEWLEVRMPTPLDKSQAESLVSSLIPWFLELQASCTRSRQERIARLREISRFPERTARFIRKTDGSRADFTDVGGIDIELCHVIGFYPEFELRGDEKGLAESGSQLSAASR